MVAVLAGNLPRTLMKASDLFSLQGKTVLLTGASGFLGSEMARSLVENDAKVILFGRSEKLEALKTELANEFGEAQVDGYTVDMYDTDVLKNTLGEAVAKTGTVDVLVNNAHEMGPGCGFNQPGASLETAPLEHFNNNLSGGMTGPVLAMQAVFPGMKEKGNGSIINTCTMYSIVAPDPALYRGTDKMNPAGYGSAKAALMQLTRYAASFWGEHGIRVNAIHPGPFANTEGTGANAVDPNAPFLKVLNDKTCLGRTGVPRELIGALLLLSSDAGSYITGQGISVDGGWTVR